MGRFDKLYARLPVWAQNTAVSAYGAYWWWLRFGSGFRRMTADYAERERWSRERYEQWIAERQQRVLELAARHVPYYRDTWTASETASAIAGRLTELPLLEKEPLRAAPEQFLCDDVHPWHVSVFHSSGSTGTPIKTIWTTPEYRDAMAVREARSAAWAGVSFRLPRATFSGRMVVPDANSAGPFHRYNAYERQVYFSAFHLRPDTAAQYVDALRKHRTQWMSGYAVSQYLLAKFILQEQLPRPALRACITTSEKVTAKMREVMTEAFGGRVFEEYSTVENVMFASECEAGRLHVSSDVGIVEILRPDGSACEPDEPGEVVATGLMRTYQPLIRYRLGDVAAWSAENCPCGRPLPVLKEVLGRIEDIVIGPDGRQLVRFHGIFADQPHIREGQIIQEQIDRLRVRIVTAPGYGQADSEDVVKRIQQRLGPKMHVIVECVAEIPRTKAGKFKAVVSLLREQGVVAAEETGR